MAVASGCGCKGHAALRALPWLSARPATRGAWLPRSSYWPGSTPAAATPAAQGPSSAAGPSACGGTGAKPPTGGGKEPAPWRT
eukprot:239322-Lingulodinium_polyedra.AAC.1